jgi:hypothetical protein
MRRSKGRTESPEVASQNHNLDVGEATGHAIEDSPSTSTHKDRKHDPEMKKQVTITVQPGVKPKPTVKKKRSAPSADLVRIYL